MIIAERKLLEEIKAMTADYHRIMILGCGTCVTVCFAGGEKEVGTLASALRMARRLIGNPIEIIEKTVQRQCEWEYIEPLAEEIEGVEAVLSLGCGIGVQALAERFSQKIFLPGVNTSFLGLPLEQGVWSERCQACGNCILDKTGGICPISRCSKSLLNGPCGGSQNGKCEIDPKMDCAWQLIYERLKTLGRLDFLTEIQPPKDWSTGRHGGPRKIIREDLIL
jgi:ferredoxin